jgi:Holliday junction resolvase-like predicted endonuclease
MGLHQKIGDGKRAELIAAEWLMGQGCYVFTPTTEQSPIDLIALTPDQRFLYFDVKKLARRKKGTVISRKLTDIQRKMGIRLLYVDLETRNCALYPHQLTCHDDRHATRLASGKAATISSLLHPES